MTRFIIEVKTIVPAGSVGYTWEATVVGMEDEPTYHYAHSRAELIAKVLAYMLGKP